MINHDHDVGELVGQVPELLHLPPRDRHTRHQVELFEQRKPAVVVRLDQVVAVGKVPDSAHVGRLAVTL